MEWIAAGIFSLLLGVVGLWTGIRQLRNRRELNQWKTTHGQVVERGTYKPNLPATAPPAFHYSPLVRYVYQIEGQQFENHCIHPKRIQLPQRSTSKWAQKKADSFPDEVTVYYNPADPKESYLKQTSKTTLIIVAAVSSLLILFGVLLLITALLSP